MSERFGEFEQSKAEFVTDVVNRTLHDLVIRCTRTEQIRDYYYISVVTYGRGVTSGLGGALLGKITAAISDIGLHPLRIDNRIKVSFDKEGHRSDLQIRFPVWIDPV
jgi:hypothetical protein